MANYELQDAKWLRIARHILAAFDKQEQWSIYALSDALSLPVSTVRATMTKMIACGCIKRRDGRIDHAGMYVRLPGGVLPVSHAHKTASPSDVASACHGELHQQFWSKNHD